MKQWLKDMRKHSEYLANTQGRHSQAFYGNVVRQIDGKTSPDEPDYVLGYSLHMRDIHRAKGARIE